jgi:hypothetical protein
MGVTDSERDLVLQERKIGERKEVEAKAKLKAGKQMEIEPLRGCWDDDGVKHPGGTDPFTMSQKGAKALIKSGAARVPLPPDDDDDD